MILLLLLLEDIYFQLFISIKIPLIYCDSFLLTIYVFPCKINKTFYVNVISENKLEVFFVIQSKCTLNDRK